MVKRLSGQKLRTKLFLKNVQIKQHPSPKWQPLPTRSKNLLIDHTPILILNKVLLKIQPLLLNFQLQKRQVKYLKLNKKPDVLYSQI